MMILAIDIGNSATKAALVDAAGVRRPVQIDGVEPARTRATLSRLIRGRNAAIVISSVVPARTRHFAAAARSVTGRAPLVVSTRLRLPLTLGVRHPARMGTDRLCAACGAVRGRRRHAIVVDAGSAITVDLVRNRRLLGGAILPGPGLALAALHDHTGRLPLLRVGGALSPRVISDTASAMRVGVGLGSAGAVQEIVRWLRRRWGIRPAVFLTGGWSADLAPLLPSGWCRDPDLVFRGIYEIAAANQPAS